MVTILTLCSVPSPDFSFHADEYLEVYVSASEHPNHFWIQIIGSRSLQLDKLVSEMTQHYENSLVSCYMEKTGLGLIFFTENVPFFLLFSISYHFIITPS